MALQTFKDVKLKYTCAAFPPDYINMKTSYSFGKDDKGYYFTDGVKNHYAEFDLIKMFFTPVNKTWQEIELIIKQ
jgi:hypothetical protein